MLNIIKPHQYNDKYYFFELDNKLKIYVITNEDIKLSCVGLCVNTGYSRDEIPGVAHLLEHMLFNGTKKYPEQNQFQIFIANNNGMTNAFTKFDSTCYYYSINTNYLEESLDMFSDFFINPLLDKTGIEKERNAVNSEHDKNLNSNGWKYNDIARQCSYGDFSKFGTGNRDTLMIDNIHEYVRNYFENYYSANIMTLIIITNEDFYTIKASIINKFNNIKNKNIENIKTEKLLITNQLIKIKPTDDIHKLIIKWDIDSFYDKQEYSPIDFIINILNRTNENSLIYYMKYEYNYIFDFKTQISDIIDNRCIIEICIELNDNGIDNIPKILNLINNYIKFLLQNIDNDNIQKLYNEIIKINKYTFYYLEKKDELNEMIKILHTISMYKFNPKYLLAIDYYKIEYNDIIKEYLIKCLTNLDIYKSVIILGSKKLNIINPLIEKYYLTEYQLSSINDYVNENNENNENMLFELTRFNFEFPPLNPYLSVKNSIIDNKKETLENIVSSCTYLLTTNKFTTPIVYINSIIEIPFSLKTNCKIYTQTLIYFNIINTIIEDVYQLCNLAGYKISVTYLNLYFRLKLSGNYSKISNICENIIDIFFNKKLLLEQLFKFEKNQLKTLLLNLKYTTPYSKINNTFEKEFVPNFYDYNDILNVIDTITYDDILNTSDIIFNVSNFTLLICGNTNKAIVKHIHILFKKFVPNKKYISEIINIKLNNQIIIHQNDNPNEINNICGYYLYLFQIDYNAKNILDDIKKICLLDLLYPLLHIYYFSILRTEEEFGYIVNVKNIIIGHFKYPHYLLRFCVQSSTKTNDEIQIRTEKFINDDFTNILNKISDDQFNIFVNNQIEQLEKPFNSLEIQSDYLLVTTIQSNDKIDFIQKQIEIFNTITKLDLINFYNIYILNKKFACIKINKNNNH